MINLLIIPYMTILSRWRGHASDYKKYLPRPWSQFLLALPFALVCAPPNSSWIAAALVLVITWGTWLTGWGNVYDLAHAKRGDKLEKIEWPIHWLYGRIPEYWYDFIGLALRGLIITLPAGIATNNPWLAISGASMAIAYAIGWAIMDWAVIKSHTVIKSHGTEGYLGITFLPKHLDGPTEIGELLFGLFLGVALVTLT